MYSLELKQLATDKTHVYADEPGFEHLCSCRNRTCADYVDIYVKRIDDHTVEMRHKGEGCMFSKASAHVLCERVKGMSMNDAKEYLVQNLERLDNGEYGEVFAAFSGIPLDSSRTVCYRYVWAGCRDCFSE